MQPINTLKAIWYHWYPGILLTLFFVAGTAGLNARGIPPQLILLLGIPLIIVPVMYIHLNRAKKNENKDHISELISYRERLPKLRLTGYTIGLIVFAFVVYGATQPINSYLAESFLSWLPEWYRINDFSGYSGNIILITLILNLILNGLLAPFVEEIYFRGYLLPRMYHLGKYAPWVSTLLFSIYHFWQPQIYLTLIIALLPMTYLTWKAKSIKLAIYTHCGLNLFGALLSFGTL